MTTSETYSPYMTTSWYDAGNLLRPWENTFFDEADGKQTTMMIIIGPTAYYQYWYQVPCTSSTLFSMLVAAIACCATIRNLKQ